VVIQLAAIAASNDAPARGAGVAVANEDSNLFADERRNSSTILACKEEDVHIDEPAPFTTYARCPPSMQSVSNGGDAVRHHPSWTEKYS
jgi:pterin-4a-carbinolamine dehydratase